MGDAVSSDGGCLQAVALARPAGVLPRPSRRTSRLPSSQALVRGQHVCIGTSEEGVVSLYDEEVGMWGYDLSGVRGGEA